MKNSVSEYNDFFYKEGYDKYYNKGSVKDYFKKNSQGKLNLDFDVYEPVTLSKNKAEYGCNATSNYGGYYATQEALSALIEKGGIDFSKYDNDKDGLIDFVIMVHSGTDAAKVKLSYGCKNCSASCDATQRNSVCDVGSYGNEVGAGI